MQPGETITPGTQPTNDSVEKKEESVVAIPEVPTTSETAPPSPEPTTSWQFSEESQAEGTLPEQNLELNPVTWTASEYIAHNKNLAWYGLLAIGSFALTGLIYLLTKDVISSVLVAIMGVAFGVFAARKPQVLSYVVDERGIQIDQKLYAYSELKSFAVLQEGPLPAFLILPLKRFLPPITVYYDSKEEDNILNTLGSYLPHEDKQPDAIERLMARIRF